METFKTILYVIALILYLYHIWGFSFKKDQMERIEYGISALFMYLILNNLS